MIGVMQLEGSVSTPPARGLTSLWLMAPGLVKFMTPVSFRLACG